MMGSKADCAQGEAQLTWTLTGVWGGLSGRLGAQEES